MNAVFAGAIADDDTGATDLAGMLAGQDMRTVLVPAGASAADLSNWTQGCDAVVIGTASRSIAREEAYARTHAAVRALQDLHVQRLAVKYCSTFDSTAEGNIGASLDALLDAAGERFVVALPALPALGRTTYMGYHFVGQQLLSDSVLRSHPLNPMTNAHLPSHLQKQTKRRVGLASYSDIARGSEFLRSKLIALHREGVEIALLDCVDDRQLAIIAEAIQSQPVLSGSSAWATVLPQIWKRSREWVPAGHRATWLTRADGGSGMLIVSGSCSEATRRQNEWIAAQGVDVLDLNALQLIQNESVLPAAVEQAAAVLRANGTCVVTTTRAVSKQQVQDWSRAQGMTMAAAGERIAAALAHTVAGVMARCRPQGLILAGGDTSSTLMRTLHLGALRVGQQIEPGVPLCVSLKQPSVAVVLKSGNYGSDDFYGRALQAIRELPVDSFER